MATHVMTFLEILRARAARTAVAPNSWAVICMWRRLFQLREEEQEQRMEILARALEQEIDEREDCPIRCEEVVQARQDFIREHYRQTVLKSSSQPRSDPNSLAPYLEQAHLAQQTRLRLNQPNLSVPTGGGLSAESLQLAQ